MGDIGFAEGHPEPDALDFGQMRLQAFDLLMVHEVHRLWSDRFEVELLLHRHRRGFDPVAIFPVARDRGDLPNAIGRSACRERRLPGGELWVVGMSIKKKKTY